MRKAEARWQTIFNQFLRKQAGMHKMFGFYELKQTEENSIPFADLKVHQAEGLQAAENSGLVWKLSDADPRTKPFDCISVPPNPSYVVIKFPDGFYIFRTFVFLAEARDNKRKSLTVERANEIAERVIHI